MSYSIKKAINLIQTFEGFRKEPYKCPAGRWTIGYGHLLNEEEKETWQSRSLDEEEALILLTKDIKGVEAALNRLVKIPLINSQYNALLSFVFNVGSGNFQRSRLRQHVNRNEHERVPAELLKWVWVNLKKSRGLMRRREAEANLYQAV